MAQAPAILEALTGVRMADLFARVPGMTVESDGAAADGDHATPPAATASPASGQAESQAESQPSPAAEPVAASDTPTDAPSDAPAEVTANAGATSLNGAAPSSARGPRRQRAR
jgi:hypothetical protein